MRPRKTVLLALVALIATLFISGCGGSGGNSDHPFTGRFNGDLMFAEATRGGGPSIQFFPFVVSPTGEVHGNAYITDGSQYVTAFTGQIGRDGKISLEIPFKESPVGVFYVGGTVAWHTNRGGSDREVSGTVMVSNSHLTGLTNYPNSTIKFWPE